MPANYTHAYYGREVFKQLSSELKQLVKKHWELYNIGLHGPDILFFYKPLSQNEIRAYGTQLHEKAAEAFFLNARKVIAESSDPEAALVYILGFINHFVLDSECHPIINQFEKDSKISHAEIESELDRVYLIKDGKNPIKSKITENVIVTDKNAQIIAPFFDIPVKECKYAIKSMNFYLDLFVAPSQLRYKFVLWAMKKAGVYDSYHGLVMNREVNKNCDSNSLRCQRHLIQASNESARLIKEYFDTYKTDAPLDIRYQRNYE